MGDWEEYRISEIADIIGGGTPKTTNPEFWDGDIPWLSIEDFNNDNRFVSKTVKTITQSGLEQSSTKFLNAGDLIISARGTVGKLAQLKKPMTFNQSCYGLQGKTQKIKNDYLYYALKTAISSLKNAGHGAVFNTITRNTFEIVCIPVPSLEEQDKIANVLGSIDDKIEVNRRMNETLEAMARAVFKSWFVDFDPVRAKAAGCQPEGMDNETAALFPSAFSPDGLPLGWQKATVSELGEVITGKTPATKIHDNYGYEIPFITIPDMHGQIFVTKCGKYLSTKGADTQKNKYLPAGAICVSCIATPGLTILTHELCQTNQQINSLIPAKREFSIFRFWQMKELSEEVISKGSGGSVFHNLNKSQFSALKVQEPSEEIIARYSTLIAPVMEAILYNQNQNMTLSALRDTLLPKLISGQLRIRDAKKSVEAVA